MMEWRTLYRKFKELYPNLSKRSAYFRPYNYMSILVYFTDGTRMVYDGVANRARWEVS